MRLLRVLLYFKIYIYICLKDPTHQYMSVLKMLFLSSKSVPTCRSMWTWAGNPCLSGLRTEWSERVKTWSVQQYVVRQEAVPFSRKLQAHQAWNEIFFLWQSATTPADEMYQNFENPEHGKFWSGGQGPVTWTQCFLFQQQEHFWKVSKVSQV